MALQCLTIDVFRQNVCWIERAGYLEQFEIFAPQTLLHPEICRMEVAYLAKPPPTADAYSRRGIGEDLQRQLYGKISRQALEAKGQACSTTDTCQLGFAARESHCALGLTVMLDKVAASHARGPAG